jgi:hypothetical protein
VGCANRHIGDDREMEADAKNEQFQEVGHAGGTLVIRYEAGEHAEVLGAVPYTMSLGNMPDARHAVAGTHVRSWMVTWTS